MSAARPIATPLMVKTMARSVAVALTLTLTLSVTASAQDRGTWWGQRAQSSRDEPLRFPSDLAEREAARLYADARAELDADRLSQAQRKLEVLVAKYPMSALADVARRDLQRVYSLVSPASLPAQAVQPQPTMVPSSRSISIAPIAIQTPAAPQPFASASPLTQTGSEPSSSAATSAVRLANEDFRQQAGDRVFFLDGSTDLGARAKIALEAQATWLIRHPDVQVVIEGHADDQGSRDLNKQLAEKRADVVRLRLNDLGVPAARMRITGLGRNEPVADCPDSSCKAQNRRAVSVIVNVPSSLGFDAPAKRSLGAAAGVVGQPTRAP
jgi:outer membrane protein OmpA-like peptidoglycan-associated protein